MTWREEAKGLGVELYDHEKKCPRKKTDVEKDIASTKTSEAEPLRIEIRKQDAVDICCAAFKAYAISKGCDPNKEIKVSRWYLNMNRTKMTFIGVKNDTNKQGSTESDEGNGTGETVSEDNLSTTCAGESR